MITPIITIQDLSVRYGNLTALKEVNLEIYPTDFLGIIGPNGGGKSTLAKAILGEVEYSGKVTRCESIGAIGYLPQISGFDKKFPITTLELVLSGLQSKKGIFSRYNNQEREQAEEVCKFVGIEESIDKQIGKLSGGQLQRALLGRAIISKPKVLILDEPTNFVDNKFEKKLYSILKDLNKEVAIIMISHDLGTISSVVKNIVCVNKSVHRHNSNKITAEQLSNYNCPLQVISHGAIPHTILQNH